MNNISVSPKKIYVTQDYSIFKKLNGNRDVDEKRIGNITQSIKEVGYITSPITVNEKYEIIDGQGRVEALKNLGLPIEYVIHPGAGVNQCISMNLHSTKWKTQDFINSNAQRGNLSYIRLKELQDVFPGFPLDVYACALKGYAFTGSKLTALLSEGKLFATEWDLETAKDVMRFLKEMKPYVEYIRGSKNHFYNVLASIKRERLCDIPKLKKKIADNMLFLPPCPTCEKACIAIENIYNKGNKSDPIELVEKIKRLKKGEPVADYTEEL